MIMVQGTASNVGKSLFAAALCRLFARAGRTVAPFKSQNMALNSFVTRESLEIGRAQAYQALAAGIEPTVDMNPILIKPHSDTGAQIVVMGKPVANMQVGEYHDYQTEGMKIALASLARLRDKYEIVVIEGAGSPAEVNLRDHDIVNMSIALAADAPVALVADIDRGGVFASIVGTMELLEPSERDLVIGYVVNKFRGDPALLGSGLDFLRERTGKPVLGVLPFLHNLRIEEEDTLGLEDRAGGVDGDVRISVVKLPHLSNYTDFLPIETESGVALRYIERADDLADAHVVIVPGSKSVLADLAWMEAQGITNAIRAARDRGAWVIGICGGYQMLGDRILDPEHIESPRESAPGLGLLPVETRFGGDKVLTRNRATCLLPWATGLAADGYEIHHGRTVRTQAAFQAAFTAGSAEDGASSSDGRVFGTYLHGIFDSDPLRDAFLAAVRRDIGIDNKPTAPFDPLRDLDRLADSVSAHVDMKEIWKAVGYDFG
ncbi:MAG: cobyric acid synthase [Capsulimonadaceae bacterium]|nr:cobyric acid synthase [Capsulimonadaceae bacterium]